MKAAALQRWGSDDLQGKRVAVQGVGHVGYYLCGYLAEEGAELVVTDLDEARVEQVVREFRASAVAPGEIYDVEADVYAPCALGATLNDDTIPRLRAAVVAGAANNQLQEPRHGDELHARDVLYAPDYVINAGGLINVYGEVQGWVPEQAMHRAGEIYSTLVRLFELSREEGIPTYRAADRMAERRIEAVGRVQRTWV
jgi:leucine dehydrogenase